METTPKVVLIVEDDVIVSMGVAKSLSARGFEIISTRTRAAAMDAFKAGVDLVVMDIDLGEEADGIDLAREMLSIRRIPVLFHSVSPYEDNAERLRGLDYEAYVRKDVDTAILEFEVALALGLE